LNFRWGGAPRRLHPNSPASKSTIDAKERDDEISNKAERKLQRKKGKEVEDSKNVKASEMVMLRSGSRESIHPLPILVDTMYRSS
jgi:hypothetical protein